jgi:hypothetical protein
VQTHGEEILTRTSGVWVSRQEGYFWSIVSEGYPEIGQILHEGNARLIAAAPELLDMLKEFVELARKNIVPSDVRMHRAMAAIAKAEGQ